MARKETVREYVERTKTVPVTIEPLVKSLECIRNIVCELRALGCKARHAGGMVYTIEALVPMKAMGAVMDSMENDWGYKEVMQ